MLFNYKQNKEFTADNFVLIREIQKGSRPSQHGTILMGDRCACVRLKGAAQLNLKFDILDENESEKHARSIRFLKRFKVSQLYRIEIVVFR